MRQAVRPSAVVSAVQALLATVRGRPQTSFGLCCYADLVALVEYRLEYAQELYRQAIQVRACLHAYVSATLLPDAKPIRCRPNARMHTLCAAAMLTEWPTQSGLEYECSRQCSRDHSVR